MLLCKERGDVFEVPSKIVGAEEKKRVHQQHFLYADRPDLAEVYILLLEVSCLCRPELLSLEQLTAVIVPEEVEPLLCFLILLLDRLDYAVECRGGFGVCFLQLFNAGAPALGEDAAELLPCGHQVHGVVAILRLLLHLVLRRLQEDLLLR